MKSAANLKKRGLSETRLAWLLLLPALSVIFAVALFPVLRTFYLSLFDLRLNNSTKNATQFHYSINIERLADTNYRLDKAFSASIKSQKESAPQLEKILAEYNQAVEQMLSDPVNKESYDTVWGLQAAMKPVPGEISLGKLTKESAEGFSQTVKDLQVKTIALLPSAVDQKSMKLNVQMFDDVLLSVSFPNYIALKNYANFLRDPRMWSSLKNTLVFTICAVFFELVLGIAIACAMSKSFRGRGLVRATVLIPWAIPASVSALIWRFMYDGQYGVVSLLFDKIGLIPTQGTLLTESGYAMFGLIFADIWKTSPYMSLLLLAGLQSIDTTLYEAAMVDGASRVQRFARITLPLLKPTMMVAIMFRTMDALRVFDLVSVMTNGGPGNGTEVITLYAYKTMFANMMFGAGSALSVIIFALLTIFCVFYIKVFGVELIKSGR